MLKLVMKHFLLNPTSSDKFYYKDGKIEIEHEILEHKH